jgi:hypothetical protein
VNDKRVPLLSWWAIEARAETARETLLGIFAEKSVWSLTLARSHGARLLARRWAQAGGAENYAACVRLLELAPGERERAVVVEGVARKASSKKAAELRRAGAGAPASR